jgi:hypothetical protein
LWRNLWLADLLSTSSGIARETEKHTVRTETEKKAEE